MSPALQPSSSETFGNFDLINRVKPGFAEITVSSWRSRTTGLNVVHLDYEGERVAAAVSRPLLMCIVFTLPIAPIVNGYFVVPTESTQICLRKFVHCLTIRSFQ